MKSLGKIVLHIPARQGSKRVPRKNMRMMNGKPMISYVIEAAIQADITEYAYVNSDSEEILDYVISEYEGFGVYKRDEILANDKATSEDFNYDIIKKFQPDTLVMVNPVCPLLSAEDITNALEVYEKSDCDTLISTTSTQMQTFCEDEPINININEKLAASQDNKRIYTLNWAITIWDAKKFSKRMQDYNYASLGNKRVFFDIDELHAVKVSDEKDFLLAEKLLSVL